MIHNDEGLEQAVEQLGRMYRILAGLHAEIAPLNYANYQIIAEGPMDEISKLRREIDEYLGITEPADAVNRSE
jgi:hypothetical protein